MALPPITFGENRVESLGRIDVGQFTNLARAQAGAVASVQEAATVVSDIYQQRRDEQEIHDVAMEAAESVTKWKESHLGKDHYTGEELLPLFPDEMDGFSPVPLTEQVVGEDGVSREVPRQDIPAYEVHPVLYKQYMEKQISTWAGRITRPSLRDKVVQKFTQQMNGEYERLLTTRDRKQKAFMRDKIMADFNTAMDNDNYAVAIASVKNSSVLTGKEKGTLVSQVQERRETDSYEKARISGSLDDIRTAMSFLRQDNEEYRNRGGSLEPRERRTHLLGLQSTYDGLTRAARAATQAQQTVVLNEVSQATRLLKKGLPVSPQLINSLRNQAAGFGTARASILLNQLAAAETYSGVFEKIASVSEAQGNALIEDAIQMSEGRLSELDRIELRASLEQANRDKATAIRTDAVAYRKKWPHIYGDASLDYKDLPNSLARIRERGHAISETYKVPPQYLDKNDWAAFNTYFNDLDLNGKLNLLGVVSEEMGDDTSAFLADGRQKGVRLLTVAGQLVAENQIASGRHVLHGHQLIQEKAVDLTRVNVDLKESIAEELGGAYSDPVQHSNMVNAIKSAYASLQWEEVKGEVQDGVDDDRLKDAIALVTRGLVEYNGRVIEAPQRGVTERSFQQYMDSVSATHLDALGGFEHNTSKQVKRALQNEDLVLVPIGDGKYYMQDSNTGFFLHGKGTNRPFVLDATQRPFTVEQEKAVKQAKRIEKAEKVFGPKAAAMLTKEVSKRKRRRQLYGIEF